MNDQPQPETAGGIDPGPGWRWLEDGERFLPGDEYFTQYTRVWKKAPNARSARTYVMDRTIYRPHRRRIVPAPAVPAVAHPDEHRAVMATWDHPRNWPTDYHLENGKYLNDCLFCHLPFVGYKRRNVCRVCSKSEAPTVPTPGGEPLGRAIGHAIYKHLLSDDGNADGLRALTHFAETVLMPMVAATHDAKLRELEAEIVRSRIAINQMRGCMEMSTARQIAREALAEPTPHAAGEKEGR